MVGKAENLKAGHRIIGHRKNVFIRYRMSLGGNLNQSELFLITVIKNHYFKSIYF